MARLNLLLSVLLIISGLYLVRTSYESRRLFAEIENAHASERQLESDRRRLEAERQAQATHLRVERTARDKLTIEAISGAAEMYDLVADTFETTNVADDPAHAARRGALEAMIASRPDDARAERLPAVGMA